MDELLRALPNLEITPIPYPFIEEIHEPWRQEMYIDARQAAQGLECEWERVL